MPVVENGRTLAGVLAELKDELREFALTRFDILRGELRGKVRVLKVSLPLIALGLALLATAWLVLTSALVTILAAAFYPSRFAYFLGLVVVGVVYSVVGGIFAFLGYRQIKEQSMTPERTLKTLKEDAAWLQDEARSRHERAA